MEAFAMGVAIGAGAGDAVPDAMPCIGDVQGLKTNVATAISEFKDLTPESISKAFELLGNTFG
jgi:hypothetical protein